MGTASSRIVKALENKKLNLNQLAEASGVSYNTLYGIVKRDTSKVEKRIIEAIAPVLDVSEAYLTSGYKDYLTPELSKKSYEKAQKMWEEEIGVVPFIPYDSTPEKVYIDDLLKWSAPLGVSVYYLVGLIDKEVLTIENIDYKHIPTEEEMDCFESLSFVFEESVVLAKKNLLRKIDEICTYPNDSKSLESMVFDIETRKAKIEIIRKYIETNLKFIQNSFPRSDKSDELEQIG